MEFSAEGLMQQIQKGPRKFWQAQDPFLDLKFSHLVSIILTLALLVVGGIQAFIYGKQTKIMQKQAEISDAQLSFQEGISRAWLKTDVNLDGPIAFVERDNTKFVTAKIALKAKNFGQVPAINIRLMAQLDKAGGGDAPGRLQTLQEAMCKDARNLADKDPIGGWVAFPNEAGPLEINAPGSDGGLYKDGNPGALVIVGCIDYTYANNRHGQTGFRKLLGVVQGNIVAGIPFVSGQPNPGEPPIPPELLAKGYPKDAAKYAYVAAEKLYFKDAEGGNFAK